MANKKWVKPKTTPPKAKKISMSQLAAKQGFKEPPGVGESAVLGGLSKYMSQALSGKQNSGQPKAAPLPKPVKDVGQLAQVSQDEAAAYADGKGKNSAKVQGENDIFGMSAAKRALKSVPTGF